MPRLLFLFLQHFPGMFPTKSYAADAGAGVVLEYHHGYIILGFASQKFAAQRYNQADFIMFIHPYHF
jgi:hypothetical protein